MLRPARGVISGALRYGLLRLLPHRALSRLVGRFTRIRLAAIKNAQIALFSRLYRVDLGEAQIAERRAYPTFNAFFTRALRATARPLADARFLLAPVDGVVSQCGRIEAGRLFQAKGRDFDLLRLLGGCEERARPFAGGRFFTLYLSPRDYHRVHMPTAGRLREMVYLPGRLFPVNDAATRHIPSLFARNERVIARFDSEVGPMALILVGALFVGGVETVWSGPVAPAGRCAASIRRYDDEEIALARGAEMGRFNMGSTVIALFAPGSVVPLEGARPGSMVRMGAPIASISHATARGVG